MPESKSQPPREQPWEDGWSPDNSRIPGTRRLWLAGALALSTIAACVTAIVVTDRAIDDASGKDSTQSPTPPADATVPGLISFATPSTKTASPSGGKIGKPTSSAGTSAAAHPGSTPTTSAKPSKSSAAPSSSPTTPKPTTTWRSVQSVNYPSRYWQVDDGYVKVDPVSSASARQDATFKLVKGLAKSTCYSFATADGTYLRHRNFVLRADRNDGSSLFKQDATFCPRASAFSGAVMLESVNYPGRYLRHKNFVVRLESYEHSDLYRQDSAFRLVSGLS